MEYQYTRSTRKSPETNKSGSFMVRFTACAIILVILAGADYAGIGKKQLQKLSYFLSYNTDTKPVMARVRGLLPKKQLKAPLSGTITTEFGKDHKGIDIAAEENTPVTAAGEGEVIEAGENSNYGNCVQIKHADGSITLYAHLNSISVNKGDVVKQGAQIGKVGSTGDSTGPHLHFEVIKDGEYQNPKAVTEGL